VLFSQSQPQPLPPPLLAPRPPVRRRRNAGEQGEHRDREQGGRGNRGAEGVGRIKRWRGCEGHPKGAGGDHAPRVKVPVAWSDPTPPPAGLLLVLARTASLHRAALRCGGQRGQEEGGGVYGRVSSCSLCPVFARHTALRWQRSSSNADLARGTTLTTLLHSFKSNARLGWLITTYLDWSEPK